MDPKRSGEEALAALAGREIVAPTRNRLTINALSQHYGIASGLEFFNLHEELEIEHFKSLWGALVKSYSADAKLLVEAARTEIRMHVAFWDAIYNRHLCDLDTAATR
jgi:pyrroloquinoline quinone (PQQ) biosynthesis protein C